MEITLFVQLTRNSEDFKDLIAAGFKKGSLAEEVIRAGWNLNPSQELVEPPDAAGGQWTVLVPIPIEDGTLDWLETFSR